MGLFLEFCLKRVAKQHGIDLMGIDMKQLKMGMDVESEHDDKMGPDIDIVPKHEPGTKMKIAVAHLREKPDYYTALKKIEKG